MEAQIVAHSFDFDEIRSQLEEYGQGHLLRYWDSLDDRQKETLAAQLSSIDHELMRRLVQKWVLNEPPAEHFSHIEPVTTIPVANPSDPGAREAWEAGERALRDGRVGLLLVAGGQGTRLGFSGPKGAYPIGPVSGKTIFEFHAEKLRNLQRRYGCALPWYIMVSNSNHASTRAFFEENAYFGLDEANVFFFQQRMVPCVDEQGKFMLDEPDRLAMNPNGHGGTIPAVVENGIAQDAAGRGVDIFSYFQVDNWAVKVADPCFIGYHVLRQAQMSSKVHRKNHPRESVGVHCLCDGEYRTIEYSELDIYPQLLETDSEGNLLYYAGNPAIHILSRGFIEEMHRRFGEFPWHRAHKKVPYLDAEGKRVVPDEPNAYKFETFIFDALRFTKHKPVALEITRLGEYTPIKQFEGSNSVQAARQAMRQYWGAWLEKAGAVLRYDQEGNVVTEVEISPDFALDEAEFIEKSGGFTWPSTGPIAIDAQGNFIEPAG